MMVGVAGFEPATFAFRTRHATRLRYTPTISDLFLFFAPCDFRVQGTGDRDPVCRPEKNNIAKAVGGFHDILYLPLCDIFSPR